MLTNADITVYNKFTDKDGNKWERHTVYDVSWQEDKCAVVGTNGKDTADKIKVYIPFTSKPDLIVRKGDIIVRNVVIFDINEADKESNLRVLRHKYNDVKTVMAVAKRDYGSPDMQHWEVTLE